MRTYNHAYGNGRYMFADTAKLGWKTQVVHLSTLKGAVTYGRLICQFKIIGVIEFETDDKASAMPRMLASTFSSGRLSDCICWVQ